MVAFVAIKRSLYSRIARSFDLRYSAMVVESTRVDAECDRAD